MNLEHLKWTKSVTPQNGEPWAYPNKALGEMFWLHWSKKSWNNASRPQKGDLILLTQKCLVTHLVEVLDNVPTQENKPGAFSIYREVKMCSPNLVGLKAVDLFGFPEILRWQNGNVKSLETSQTFKQRWSKKGGLKAFRKHVAEILKLTEQLQAELNRLNDMLESYGLSFDPDLIDGFLAETVIDPNKSEDYYVRSFNRWRRTH